MATATMTKDMTAVINTQLANWTVMFMKLHHYHWFVKGEQFFTLHAKFEELYDKAGDYIDDLAERILALGGKPLSTLKEALQKATVQEAAGNERPEAMVQAVVSDFATMPAELKDGIKAAQQAEDETTADMLIGIQCSLEKQSWLLKSFLGK